MSAIFLQLIETIRNVPIVSVKVAAVLLLCGICNVCVGGTAMC